MLRWDNIEDKELFGMTVKMYRDPFVAYKTVSSPLRNTELDHHAFKFLGSELLMYRILDTNFERYIEERGDVFEIENILIPTSENSEATIL